MTIGAVRGEVGGVKFNHLFRKEAVKGSVALCGHVKRTNTGFNKAVGTCNDCVAKAFILKKVKALPSSK